MDSANSARSNAGGVRPRGAVVRAGRGANIVRDQVSRLRLKIFWGAQCAFVPRIKNTILASSVPERKSQSGRTATELQVKPRSTNWWRIGWKRFAPRTSIGILSNHSPESRFRNEATHAKRRYWAVAFGNHPPQKKFAQRGIFRVRRRYGTVNRLKLCEGTQTKPKARKTKNSKSRTIEYPRHGDTQKLCPI